jgi:hypothetical protein
MGSGKLELCSVVHSLCICKANTTEFGGYL